jgi:menaquinone-dependent protoporphyrinogen oxidase
MPDGTRVLVVYGSKAGGTTEIATAIADTLHAHGLDAECRAAAHVSDVSRYAAVIVGGALYMFRWHRDARRFVARHAAELRRRPVWMFSSGPLDDSAARREVPPVRGVAALMARIGARGHATFGGRLSADAPGFVASRMARTHAGDWRDWEQIRGWATRIAEQILERPRVAFSPLPRDPLRRVLLGMCLAISLMAVGGGLALVAAPDGALLGMPPTTLEHSPFTSFLVPGLLLLIVIGGGHLLAGLLVARRSPVASAAAFAAGFALVTWIVVQMAMLRTVNPLHVSSLVLGLTVCGIATRRRARERAESPRQLAPAA